jgi:hypothetical protein
MHRRRDLARADPPSRTATEQKQHKKSCKWFADTVPCLTLGEGANRESGLRTALRDPLQLARQVTRALPPLVRTLNTV